MLKEFKVFIAKGNVLDLAIGVIIGGAFSSIVTSLVNNIFTPLFGIVLGGLNFSKLSIKVGDAEILYGAFIQSVVDFLLVALCLFIFIKIINKARSFSKKKKEEEVVAEETPADIKLLEEIRDLLKKGKNK